jgi:AraC-like DNA-binding protein
LSLAAPVHGADGHLLASLQLTAADADHSNKYAPALRALLDRAARSIDERLFRIQYRRHWVVSAFPEGEPPLPIMIAVDGDLSVVGADRRAQKMLCSKGRRFAVRMPLRELFRVDAMLIPEWRQGDAVTRLTSADDDKQWPALITPPCPDAELADWSEHVLRYTCPRWETLASKVRQAASDQTRGRLPLTTQRRIAEHIDIHLDTRLSVEELADKAGLSAAHFSRTFRRSFGVTPHCYVLSRRLAKAQALLVESDLALADVALAAGFADQSHLCRTFRRLVGVRPRQFRAQYR